MATNAQIDANRANARHSTGPRTPAGIAACKLNALKHGLSAQHAVIAGEDPDAYDALRASFIDTYAPANEAEAMLVERLSISWWKLRRAEVTHARMVAQIGNPEDAFLNPKTADLWRNFHRHYTAVERAWRSAFDQLTRIAAARAKNQPQPTAAAAIGSVLHAAPVPAAKPVVPFPQTPSRPSNEEKQEAGLPRNHQK
jgi:hypothetical protein